MEELIYLSILIIENILISLLTIFPVLIAVAFFTLTERKTMALIQRRLGPNVVGFWGLLQPIADGVKLIFKEIIIPSRSNFFFLHACVLSMTLSFCGWGLIPFNFSSVLSDISISLLAVFALSSLNVYSIILAGWSSNSKYALLGAVRGIAQLISYELGMVLSVIPVIIFSESLNLIDIVLVQRNLSFFVFLLPAAISFFICIVAETNRAPFDLPEAEAEIVAGYNIEYSSLPFALFFLGEYCQIILMSSLWVLLFFGGWFLPFLDNIDFLPPSFVFSFKIAIICFLFVFIRANLPRYRYDQLLELGWKILIPLTFMYIFIILIFNIIFISFFNIQEFLSVYFFFIHFN